MNKTKKQPAIKALVVEDNRPNMKLILFILKKLRIVAIPAFSGEAALEKTKNEVVDILLLDINLGDSMSGIDLLKILRLRDAFKTTPAVAISAYSLDQKFLFEAGFDAIISKPYKFKTLIDILNKFLPDRDTIKIESIN